MGIAKKIYINIKIYLKIISVKSSVIQSHPLECIYIWYYNGQLDKKKSLQDIPTSP